MCKGNKKLKILELNPKFVLWKFCAFVPKLLKSANIYNEHHHKISVVIIVGWLSATHASRTFH